MPDTQIFKATYSGIPVYEMMCKGVAVMRRRSDSWLNATQILKVAGFDKPQRTRVLEREIQKGEHEKVQGGYGKYQGTWIPLERASALAKQYGCDQVLRPIIGFEPAAKSPPLAPKHLVSNTAQRPARRSAAIDAPNSVAPVNTRSSRRQAQDIAEPESDHETLTARGSEDGSMTPSRSGASSSSRTPFPIHSPAPEDDIDDEFRNVLGHIRTHRTLDEAAFGLLEAKRPKLNGAGDSRMYGDQILEYFISDSNHIPQVLISPPSDFDANMAIDEDGHTSLHWACAMGRIGIVKLLLTAGADIFKVNKAGQTALMRSVMFANNYDVRKFPELYELLRRATLNIDNFDRTVFHHVVDVALSKGKVHAARYYMETILDRLSDYPKDLADVINFQDGDGETALTLAAKCRSKRLVKFLIDHGADPKITNKEGKNTEDYILEDEHFHSSPTPFSHFNDTSYRNQQLAIPHTSSGAQHPLGTTNGDRRPIYHSVAAQRASTRCVKEIGGLLDNLAFAFDQELRDKERDMAQAHALLSNIQAEILESQRAVTHMKAQAEGLEQTEDRLKVMEEELLTKMERRYRLGWEKWVKDEELDGPPVNGVDSHSVGKGKRKSEELEDVSGLQALFTSIPSDPEQIGMACEDLRDDITGQRKRRKVMFKELVAFQAEAGTSGRMGEYRRLIGAGCSLPPSGVDQVLEILLETLESEEQPSSSSIAWGGMKATLATTN